MNYHRIHRIPPSRNHILPKQNQISLMAFDPSTPVDPIIESTDPIHIGH